ncbi:MAG: hypothetical protein WBA17_11570 [Saprospiraceae bacterium]
MQHKTTYTALVGLLLLCVPALRAQAIYQLPQPAVQKLLAEDGQSLASRFAAPLPLALDPTEVGEWTTDAGGESVWRLTFQLDGTLGLAAFLSATAFPATGTLTWTNENGSYGPFTATDFSEQGRLFSGFLPGKAATLEYRGPGENTSPFQIWRVDHAYRSDRYRPRGKKNPGLEKDFGTSNTCQIDANCPLGDGWENEKDATARLIVIVEEGSGYCTGNLINNTGRTGRPLVLTAFHCQDTYTPIYDLWRFDFGFILPTCNSTTNQAPPFTAYAGGRLLAGRRESDFLLLEITDIDFNEEDHYFAGWDATDGFISGGMHMLHHPIGDAMMVSNSTVNSIPVFFNVINWNNDVVTPAAHHYRVDFTEGTFEVGSSGGAIYDDPNHRIHGQLNGGIDNCPGNTLAYYGRLFNSWTGGGTPATRLRDWLDPLSLDTLVWDGEELAGNVNGATVRGYVKLNNVGVAGAKMIVQSTNGLLDSAITGPDGFYSIPRPVGITNFSVRGSFTGNPNTLAGISTLDIVRIRRHILGLDTMSLPAQLAADVNATGSVTTLDIVGVTRQILGLDMSGWPSRPTWVMVPEQLLSDPPPTLINGPYPLNLTEPNAMFLTINWTVVKTGDANLSASQ